jgi:hypothetical protein
MSDPITDLKQELLAAAERQHRQDAVPADQRPLRTRVHRPRLLVTLATLAIAAGLALFVTAPWSGSPDFLTKAQAALTPPTGTVLHVKYRFGRPRGTRRDQCAIGSEFWIDQTPPYRYRILRPFPVPAFCSTSRPTTAEIGGTQRSRRALRFVPPNTLRAQPGGQFPRFRDPVQGLRDALRAGTAVDDGQTQLDGRTVQRIRIGDESWYVDPQTFYPIEVHQIFVDGLCERPGNLPPGRCRGVVSILAYEYLPPTTANLALTNIRAQHPNATISG